MHRRQHWPWYITLWYSVQGIYGVPSCVVSKILWDPPPWKRQACVHTGILTHADLGARVCDLIKRRILAFFFFFGSSKLVVCCLIPEHVICTEMPSAVRAALCDCVWPVFQLSRVGLFSPSTHAGLPGARMQPRDVLIRDPQRVGAAEIHQRRVNLHVFCSHFNCDRELSFGNSLSAWEKALLPFKWKKVGGLETRKKRVTEADARSSPVGEVRLLHSSWWQETLRWDSYKIWDQHLGQKGWNPLWKRIQKKSPWSSQFNVLPYLFCVVTQYAWASVSHS